MWVRGLRFDSSLPPSKEILLDHLTGVVSLSHVAGNIGPIVPDSSGEQYNTKGVSA
ncbi:MAG: hypothetical protein F6K16_11720 [Symploca sp. SIO2B6]|nr:hypothetical protein [Symploca sp. SIO2B6]